MLAQWHSFGSWSNSHLLISAGYPSAAGDHALIMLQLWKRLEKKHTTAKSVLQTCFMMFCYGSALCNTGLLWSYSNGKLPSNMPSFDFPAVTLYKLFPNSRVASDSRHNNAVTPLKCDYQAKMGDVLLAANCLGKALLVSLKCPLILK